ncbi:MAG: hypothetical protein IJ829_08405, partial [Kiritimatiellae bacterium]|nr:hypothetical protein [Kiritimatiellia bacterium]
MTASRFTHGQKAGSQIGAFAAVFLFVSLTAGALAESGASSGGWRFLNAEHSAEKAVGRLSRDALEIALPSKLSCAWWEREFAVAPGRGVRFRATAEVALGEGERGLYNDLMMFVTWYDPSKGRQKGVGFYQRDFMRYADMDGLRVFDDVFAVPGTCDT